MVCLLLWLLFRGARANQTEISSSDHYTQLPKSTALSCNLMKVVSASVLHIEAKQLKAKTLVVQSARGNVVWVPRSSGVTVQENKEKPLIHRHF